MYYVFQLGKLGTQHGTAYEVGCGSFIFLLQEEINNGLETLLSRQCHLEAKLRGITKVLPNLQLVHSDAQQLAEMITFTSTLAENVSSKVRQLDIARVSFSACVCV
jgi:hypothetical protein